MKIEDMPKPKLWVLLRRRKCVPERKGPFPSYSYLKDFLLEVFKHEKCFVTVLTVYPDGDIDAQDGPQWMHIFYPRHRKAASKYLEKLNAEDEFREVKESAGEIIKGTIEPGLVIEKQSKFEDEE